MKIEMKKVVISLIIIMSMIFVLMPSATAYSNRNCAYYSVTYYLWQNFPSSSGYVACRSYCWAMGYECWDAGVSYPDGSWGCACGFIDG